MKYKNIIAVVAVSMTLTSCGLYDKYVSKASVPANAYGTSQDIVEATTGSLTAKATFPNPEGHLFSGIQGTVVLPFSEQDVIVIPQNAVVRLQDKSLVYKVKADSTAMAVDVTTSDIGNGKDVIVVSGLKVGDKIVTEGANNVQEGQKVLFPKEVSSEK